MYERDISKQDPGCVVFLLDRSDSMKQPWGNSRETMAEGAARALNETLLELLFTSQGEPGEAPPYFFVRLFRLRGGPGGGGGWGPVWAATPRASRWSRCPICATTRSRCGRRPRSTPGPRRAGFRSG